MVVVRVVAVVAYREVIREPDGEIALVHLAGAVHDVAVRGCIVVRGRADDRRPNFGPAAFVLGPRRTAEHDDQDDDGDAKRKSGAHSPREIRIT